MMRAIGYYPSAGSFYLDAACPSCHEKHGAGRCSCCVQYVHDESEPVFHDSESDTPTHCAFCESLIPHRLTPDGREYVAEALHVGSGRADILAAWSEAYGVTA